MRRGKETIATDMDEVLFPFVEQFAEWHNREYGTSLGVEDFHSYEFGEVIDESIKEIVHRVKLFITQEGSHLHIEPVEKARETITQMSLDFDFVAVTARHPDFEQSTRSYIEHHFQHLIPELRLVGHKETVDVVVPKIEICRSLGASALVDDSVEHVSECSETKVQGILFGNYPWNRDKDVPEDIVRCENWEEILEYAYTTANW